MADKPIKTFDWPFWIVLILFILLCGLICYFPIMFTTKPSMYDFNTTGQIGDTIGGIMGPFIAMAAAFLTFFAFWVQFKANEQQKADIAEQKDRSNVDGFETRFMEMVKIHRENVNELSFTAYSRKRNVDTGEDDLEKHTAPSRKVFKEIFNQFKSLNEELSHFFDEATAESVYTKTHLEEIRLNGLLENIKIDDVTYAKIDIIYCIIYYGLGSDDSDTIENFFYSKYNESFYVPILKFASLKPKIESDFWGKWVKFNRLEIELKTEYFEIWKKHLENKEKKPTRPKPKNKTEEKFYSTIYYSNNYYKYYGGHQFRLGHYFRHLYQTVVFVNNSDLISYKAKYENIKLLRAQLSNFEQIVLFLNSISMLGRSWELNPNHDLKAKIDEDKWLITKYNLIKNIPKDEIVDGIFASDFYPLVAYELKFKPDLDQNRKDLKEKYIKNEPK